ncbi:MAG: ParB-like nuclease domain-containing protein [Planctomycetota bacterium]|nr:MAG: ParB-like nuclease domain-containing protein [Planctomycetota bacterium]
MANAIRSIALDKLVAHPASANRQSRVTFGKLVRNIERSGLYEPLIVRPCAGREGCFEIINGCHRWRALTELGYKRCDCVVWEVDDEEAEILLSTLNRLGGTDELGKKQALLRRLNKKRELAELGKVLPQTARQIERLVNMERPGAAVKAKAANFANPVVFFVDDTQQQIIAKAISLAGEREAKMTKAGRRATGLATIAKYFLDNSQIKSRS